MIIKWILEQNGGLRLRSHRETCGIQHLRPRQLSGNSTTIGAKVGILGDSHPGLNSSEFFFSSEMLFRLPESEFPGNRRGVKTDTLAARHIFTCTVTPTDHTAQMTCVQGSRSLQGSSLSCVSKIVFISKIVFHLRVMCHLAPQSTLNTSTSSLSSTSPVLHSSTSPTTDLLFTRPYTHCKDPRQDGTSTEYQPLTTVVWLSYSQSLIHSAYDSAESIAMPPDSELEDEQLRKMLASPLYTEVSGKRDTESAQKRRAQRTQANHSRRESLMSNSSRDLEISGKPDAVFSCHSESGPNTFSERNRNNESGNRFESSVRSVFRIAEANAAKSLP